MELRILTFHNMFYRLPNDIILCNSRGGVDDIFLPFLLIDNIIDVLGNVVY